MSCDSNDFLLITECVSQCPEGTYSDWTLMTCVSCVSPCIECSSSTTCSSCTKPFYLSGDQCVEDYNCPAGTYPEAETNICENCYENCLSCIGPNRDQCTDCNEDAMEIVNYYGACNPILCTEEQYAEASSCIDCNPLCATCDSSEGCLECKDGSIPLLQDGAQVQCEVCPEGFEYSSGRLCEGKAFINYDRNLR